MSFEVKIDVFEGPFDLLYQLITSREMDIHQVRIAVIADSYLEHLEAAEHLDLDTATEFLLIAATLLLLKARSLLPPSQEEEEDDAETAREYLVERLIEYQAFSGAASHLAERYAEHGSYLPRMRELEEDYAHLYPDPFEGVGPEQLSAALADLLVERAGRWSVDFSYIAPVKVSIEAQMEKVRRALELEEFATFDELASGCGSKLEVIATFLAILEMFKHKEVEISQRRTFGKIELRRREGENDSAA